MQDKVLPHDLLLIDHELMEMDLVNAGVAQQYAHDIANQRYNYTEACDKYDKEMGFDVGHYYSTESGAITRLSYLTH